MPEKPEDSNKTPESSDRPRLSDEQLAHLPVADPAAEQQKIARDVEDELAAEKILRQLQGPNTPSVLQPAPKDEPKGLLTVEVKTRDGYRETITALKEIFNDPTDLETDRRFAELFFQPKLARYFKIEDGEHNAIGVQLVRINQDHVPDAMYTPYGGVKSDYQGLNIYPQAARLNGEQMRQFGVKFGMNDCEDPKRMEGVYKDEPLEQVIDRCNRRLNFFKRSLGMYFVDDDAVPYCRPASDNPKNIQAYDLLGFRALDLNDPMWKNVFNEDKTAITKEAYGNFYLKLMQLEYGDAKGVPSKEELRAEYPAVDQFFTQMDALAPEKEWIKLHEGPVREKTTPNISDTVRFDNPNDPDERKSRGEIDRERRAAKKWVSSGDSRT